MSGQAMEWRAHWPKVVSGMIGMSFYAMLTYHFGLFIQPLEKEFGWDRADISLGLTISTLFTTSRGLALALVLCGSAIAQSLSPLIANALIADRGWREAYQWIGLGWGGISLLLILFFFFDAHDQKKRSTAAPAPVSSLGGLTVGQAVRNSKILRIAFANLCMPMVGAGVSVHLVPMLSGTGIDRTTAAGMAATAGIAGIVGKLLTGWLLDRFQGNFVPFISSALGAICYILLLNTLHSNAALVLGVMILGYTSGAGLQVTAYLISRYGGLRNFGKVYATIGSMQMLGTSLAPWIAGSVFDHTGSYNALLLTAAPVALFGAAMFIGLGAYPTFADTDGLRPAKA